jgi:glucose-fructose oxidoreductase
LHQLVIGERTKKKTFPKPDQFTAEVSYFSDCVSNGKQPEPSGREGLADIRIVRAIYESARTGKVVELADFAKKDRPSMKQEIDRPPHDKPGNGKS